MTKSQDDLQKSKERVSAKAAKPQPQRGASKLGGKSVRKIETRRKLLAVARKLFAENGYDDTSPNDVARLAGVAHGTFYVYFDDKLDCFSALAEEALHELSLVNRWFYPTEETPAAMISSMLRSTFEYSLSNPGMVRAALSDFKLLSHRARRKSRPPFGGKSWVDMIEIWKDAGLIAQDTDSNIFAYLVTGAMKQGNALVTRNPRNLGKVVESLTLFLTRAIEAREEKRSAQK